MNITADSSTLILMSKTTITREIYNYIDSVLISKQVFKEIVEAGKKDNKEDAIIVENLIKEGKIKVKGIKNHKFIKGLITDFKINQGEAEAITLALQEKTSLLTDDKECIKICRVYDIIFITALSFLVKLVKDKLLDKKIAMIKIDSLKKIGYYSKDIIEDAIRECN